MVIVTHQIGFIKDLTHRIVFIDEGQIAALEVPITF